MSAPSQAKISQQKVKAQPPAPAAETNVGSNGHEFKAEEIAALAYSYWEARGCQGGSPEEDWFRAELELRGAATAGKEAS